MHDLTLIVWLRYTLAIMAVVVAVWLIGLCIRYWTKLDFGQKLWSIGAIAMLLYVADGLREAAAVGLPFRWRLLLVFPGLIAYFAYLLETRQRKLKRFGRHPFQ